MKKSFTVFIAMLLACSTWAQQKVINDANAQQRPVTAFHAIKVSNGIELLLQQGTEEALAVSAENTEYRDLIKTEVNNGVLRIYVEAELLHWRKWNNMQKKLRAYVSFKNLDNLSCTSGAKAIIEGNLTTNDIRIVLSSGASVTGNLAVGSLKINQSSGAYSHLKGTAQNLNVDVSSGAHFKGYDLTTEKCDAEASSGAQIQITVNKELNAGASSGAGIYYKGSGGIANYSASSGGKIKRDS